MGRTAENGLKSNPEAVTRGERALARWLFDGALALTRAEKSRIQPLVTISLSLSLFLSLCVSKLSVRVCMQGVACENNRRTEADEKSRG